MSVGFFYGWKYYKEKYDQEKDDYNEKITQDNSLDKSALLIGEKYIDKDKTKWGDIYFIDSIGEQKFTIDIAHDVSIMANPQATKTNLFYYEPGEKQDDLNHMILWAADFKGASENKIASFSKDYYPMGIWMSPDYSTVAYLRSYNNEEYSYWVFHNENGVASELVAPAANLHPVHYQGFNAAGDKFHYLEKYDNSEYRLNQAKIQGSIISPAFRGVEWRNVSWDYLWEVKPIAISPGDDAMVYLDKVMSGDIIKKTEIKKISEVGEFTDLASLTGNIYELRWSPDGKFIAYNHIIYSDDDKIKKITVEIIESNGSKPEVIYETSDSSNQIFDLFWDKTNKYIYFVDSQRGVYSEIIKADIEAKQSEVIYRREAGDKNDYIKILQTIEIPKDLNWQSLAAAEAESSAPKINLTEVFKYIEKNINILAVEEPQENEFWRAAKIGYVTDSDYYVEYGDNANARRLLLHCINEKSKIKCDVTASFQPEGYQWKLADGNDYFADKDVIYYEYREGVWEESYSSASKEVFPYNIIDIKQQQKAVEDGEEQWRLDPVKVVQEELPEKFGLDNETDVFDLFLSEDGEARVRVEHNGQEYEVKLLQLVKEGEGGAWTLVRIKNI